METGIKMLSHFKSVQQQGNSRLKGHPGIEDDNQTNVQMFPKESWQGKTARQPFGGRMDFTTKNENFNKSIMNKANFDGFNVSGGAHDLTTQGVSVDQSSFVNPYANTF